MFNHLFIRYFDWIDSADSSHLSGERPGEIYRHIISRLLPAMFTMGLIFDATLNISIMTNRTFLLFISIISASGIGIISASLHMRKLSFATYFCIFTLMGIGYWVQSFQVYTMPYIDNTLLVILFPIGIAGFVYGNRGIIASSLSGFLGSISLISFSNATILPHLYTLITDSVVPILVFLIVFGVGMNSIRGFLLSSYSQSWQQMLRMMFLGIDDDVINLKQELFLSYQTLERLLGHSQMREMYLESVIDNISPDGFIVCDEDGIIIKCNDGILTTLQLAREMIIGKHISLLCSDSGESSSQTQQILDHVKHFGLTNAEHIVHTQDGRQLYIDININWVVDLKQFVLIARDNTQKHLQQEEILRQLEETQRMRDEFFTMLDALEDGVVFYTTTGNEIYRNRANVKQTGIQPNGGNTIEQISAMNILHNLDGTIIPVEMNPVNRVLHGEEYVRQYLRIVQQSHEILLIEALTYSVNNMLTDSKGILVITHDITEQMRVEQYNKTLRNIVHICAASNDIQSLVGPIVSTLVESLNLSVAFIIVPDPDRPGFAKILGIESYDEELKTTLMQKILTEKASEHSPYITASVIRTGNPIYYYNRDRPNTTIRTPSGRIFKPSLVYSYPLHFTDDVTGAITLIRDMQGDQEVFGPIDPAFIQAIGEELSTSLHRVHMYEEAVRYSTHDPLTGLWNHRELQIQLQDSIAFRMFLGLPLSLMMIDIDHFHHFNVKYGHAHGDLALKEISSVITGQLGDMGFAARYSGEEFAVVLPDIDFDYCTKLAEKIRTIIEISQAFTPRFTVSIGYATFPNHASASTSLIKASEIALHAAKRSGRNCSIGYTSQLLQSGIPGIPLRQGEMFEMQLPSGADLETVQALVAAVDLRDGYTASHSSNVSHYAVSLGTTLMLPTEQIEALRLGGLIHDVGKIGVPDQILRKPGKLTAEEWEVMMKHTIMGEEIVRSIEPLRHLLPLIRWHHERLDGSGYPDGLKADHIPFLVRVLSVADIFDAFTAERPYHLGRTPLAGMQLLRTEAIAGKLDLIVVNAMEQILHSQGLLERVDLDIDLDAA